MSSEESREPQHSENDIQREPPADMLPAYALGVLDPDDERRVASALATSPELRAELAQLQDVVDALNASHPETAPPPDLRGRILQSAGAGQQPVNLASRGFRHSRALAAPAAVLILLMGAVIALLAAQVRELDEEIDDLQASSARPSTDFTQPLVWTNISASSDGSEVSGYFCRTEAGNVGWIVVEGMHAEDDQIFQLWLVDGNRVVNGGMFATDEEGRGFGVVRAGEPVQTFEQIWITAEPPGGSPLPTSEPDLTAPII